MIGQKWGRRNIQVGCKSGLSGAPSLLMLVSGVLRHYLKATPNENPAKKKQPSPRSGEMNS
ncbi:MAG: hypothetical protein NXI27_04300 [Alphaproteobacteria bacterium]|nr:hypothetical protein [Alphaproteobacteria bacterium]